MKCNFKILLFFVLLFYYFTSLSMENEAPSNSLEWNGLIAMDYRSTQNFDKNKNSQFIIDTIELSISKKINPWVNADLTLLREDSAESPEIDNATITIKNDESIFYSQVGYNVIPFGWFETNMLSFPLTQLMIETHVSNLRLGLSKYGINFSVFAFNGLSQRDSDHLNENDEMKGFGSELSFEHSFDNWNFFLGGGYISAFGDLDGVYKKLTITSPNTIVDPLSKSPAGLALFLKLNWKNISFTFEQAEALSEFDSTHLIYSNKGAQPKVQGIELSSRFAWLDKNWVSAIGTQMTQEAFALELPKQRTLFTLGCEIYESTMLQVEYLSGYDYKEIDGGTGNAETQTTLQLAVHF